MFMIRKLPIKPQLNQTDNTAVQVHDNVIRSTFVKILYAADHKKVVSSYSVESFCRVSGIFDTHPDWSIQESCNFSGLLHLILNKPQGG